MKPRGSAWISPLRMRWARSCWASRYSTSPSMRAACREPSGASASRLIRSSMIGPSLCTSAAASKRARSSGESTRTPSRSAARASARRASPSRPVQRRTRSTVPTWSWTSIGRAEGPTRTSTPVMGPPPGGIGTTRTVSPCSAGSRRTVTSSRSRGGSAASSGMPPERGSTRSRTSPSSGRTADGCAPSRSTITARSPCMIRYASPGRSPTSLRNSASPAGRIVTSA